MTTLAPDTGRGRPPSRTDHTPLHHREVHAMNTQIQFLQAVHADRLARSLARPGRPADRRRGVRSGAADRPPDAGRFPLMRGRPASPTPRETFQ
jgi:hypothetical protein